MSSKCPPVTLNVDEIVKAAKDKVMKSCPSFMKNGESVEADVHSVGIRGLGKIALMEQQLNIGQFALGFATVPSVVNVATKIMQVGILPFQADMAVTRSIAVGATLIGTLLSGGKSFLLGALLGQVPTTIDALGDIAITAFMKAKGVTPAAPLKGLGAAEDEILKLREDLQKLTGLGTATEYAGERTENPETMRGAGVRFHY